MYKVKQAVILAAGIGNRMQPVTYYTPKPLIKVNGIRMIDTIIQALHTNGIYEIYIVVGYKKEQFESWKEAYDGIQLINNPYYNNCNNISSLYIAREHLENSLILDGDQIIYNPDIVNPFFERSGYNAVWTEQHTNEWLMTVKDSLVTHCSRNGGAQGWRLYSISRWSAEDGRKLKKHLETEFLNNNNRQIYWDDVPMFCYSNEYQLGIRKMQTNDVLEIDNYEELLTVDPTYKTFVKDEISNDE